LFEKQGTYFLRGQAGYNILSAKENGTLNDLIVAHDITIKLKNYSFELYKKGDDYTRDH
jgi:hypothetical protein